MLEEKAEEEKKGGTVALTAEEEGMEDERIAKEAKERREEIRYVNVVSEVLSRRKGVVNGVREGKAKTARYGAPRERKWHVPANLGRK